MTHRTLPTALSLALAFAVASFGTLLAPSDAQAAEPKGRAAETQAPAKDAAPAGAKAKPKAQRAPKAKAKKGTGTKARASAKAASKPGKAAAKPSKTKRSASRENKATPKRAKPQPKADDSPAPGAARSAQPAAPCTGAAVSFDRGGVEGQRFALVDCQQKPLDGAIAKVSVLARPWGSPRPSASKVTRIDAGMITRLEAIAKKLPGRTLSIVGGPQPAAGGGSAHQAGRALDLRVDGVESRKLVEICRSLPDTGCGYYPNASFVHVDVRAPGAGKAFWIDASEPGEPPRYVTSWPPPSGAEKAAEK